MDFLLTIANQITTIFCLIKEENYGILKDNFRKFHNYFSQTLIIIEPINKIFHNILNSLTIFFQHNISQHDWKTFEEELNKVLKEQRYLKLNWDFNYTQHKKLERYFKANLLFVECLKLASVDKELREKLLDSLLLPPNSYTL